MREKEKENELAKMQRVQSKKRRANQLLKPLDEQKLIQEKLYMYILRSPARFLITRP